MESKRIERIEKGKEKEKESLEIGKLILLNPSHNSDYVEL